MWKPEIARPVEMMRPLHFIVILLNLLLGSRASAQEGRITGIRIEPGETIGLQIDWELRSSATKFRPPVFRAQMLLRTPKGFDRLVGGSVDPKLESSVIPVKRGSPARRGNTHLKLVGMQPGSKMVDYRVEIWANGQRLAARHGPNYKRSTFEKLGLSETWYEQAIGGVPEPNEAKVNAAIDRGVAFLKSQQEPEGTWKARSGYTALATTALIKSGLGLQDESVRKAVIWLRKHDDEVEGTYDVACTLLMLAALDDARFKEWMQQLVIRLAKYQKSGTWGYPSDRPDLSNTQYAALGLWAASLKGAKVPERIWATLADQLGDYMDTAGSFAYRPLPRRFDVWPEHDTFPGEGSDTMTAAGAGTAIICLKMLPNQPEHQARRQRLTLLKVRGLSWVHRAFNRVDRLADPQEENTGYYLYGLERVGALARSISFGNENWYNIGAARLLFSQTFEGGWPKEPIADTSFALLFLERATLSTVSETDPAYAEQLRSEHEAVSNATGAVSSPVNDAEFEAWKQEMNQKRPMASEGDELELKLVSGKIYRGRLIKIESEGIVFAVGGRRARLAFDQLDATSRVRVESAFREQRLREQFEKHQAASGGESPP